MGTRGAFGVRVNGQDKLTYNHFDSYPEGLGKTIVRDIQAEIAESGGFEGWRVKAATLRAVQEGEKPTPEDIERLKDQADLQVGEQSLDDWYCLLRKNQGELASMLTLGVFIDNHRFMGDSLFCEWAYVVNLDNGTLECYRGFQEKQHNRGRYAIMDTKETVGEKTFYPVALIGCFPLHKVTEADMEQLARWDYFNKYPEDWKCDHEGEDPPLPPENLIQDPSIAMQKEESDGLHD